MVKKKFSEFDLISTVTNDQFVGYNPSTLKNIRSTRQTLIKAVTEVKTSSYPITDTDKIERLEMNTAGGALIVTMPVRANNIDREITIANIGTNELYVVGYGGESSITYDGLSSITLFTGEEIQLKECATLGKWKSKSDFFQDKSMKHLENFIDSDHLVGVNDIHYFQTRILRNIWVRGIKFFVTNGSAAGDKCKYALYTDNLGYPGTLIAQTEEYTFIGANEYQSISLLFAKHYGLLKDGLYHVSLWTNKTMAFQKGVTWSGRYKYSTLTYTTNFPTNPSGFGTAGAYLGFELI